MKRDVIVIGAGAAGLMCAVEAGKRGRSVTVLEHAERIGKKILISGGGRCNFTNLHTVPEGYLSSNADFCKSALARFTPADMLDLVEKHRIRYHEKKLGQLFCDGSSRQIVDLLEKECAAARVEIRTGCQVRHVAKGPMFRVETAQEILESDSLVIATGGLSFPKLGATDFGHRLARQFGLNLIEPRPGLVPLTFSSESWAPFRELSGISIDSEVHCSGASFRENLLLTHRGLSGPAILQISSYFREGESLRVDLLPDRSAVERLESHQTSSRELSSVLGDFLPRRFIQAWCSQETPSRPMNRFTPQELQRIIRALQNWKVQPRGTEGYAKAEVTLGGVDTRELSSKTMESRRVPGLFLIGELVDVTGWLGGYNFQWAWASGHAAGQFV